MSLLRVADLRIRFTTRRGPVQAVDGSGFSLERGEIVGLVGESGSGKSQILYALMGLLPENATQTGAIDFTGSGPAMVFQDPMTALNPYLPIGLQIAEAMPKDLGRAARRARTVELLTRLRIADPETRIDQYPHQLSGGMRQRIVIAMALAAAPDLILADEPTTALDVTVQADILDLLRAERRDHGRALLLVSHDLGVVAGLCDRVLVMYAGRIVEEVPVDDLFAQPSHPYTRALLATVSSLAAGDTELATIPGAPPDLGQPIAGCAFAPRCALRIDRCTDQRPAFHVIGPAHRAACHLAETAGAGP
jgi:oligopeptide transport system ATP-binding protein